MSEEFLSFKLSDDFVLSYSNLKPNWGFPIGAGDSLGEIVFFNNYSRVKEDGTKERWHETCRRVIEGYYSILKDHCHYNKTPWNESKASASAKEAYDRMFSFKWLPPGRGIWAMGTKAVNSERNAAMLYNCAVLTTAKISSHSAKSAVFPFVRLMEMSMNGIGVGFDTRGTGNITIHAPATDRTEVFIVPDTREGWSESLGVLLESYFFENRATAVFDYSLIRPSGTPLKRFGGTASGPVPLIKMHEKLTELLVQDVGHEISSQNIVDIMNLAAKAVVAGGSRRSALLALGEPDDKEFVNLKNYDNYPERNGADGWAYLSNNSVIAEVGGNYEHLIDLIADNGEPGILYLDMARNYGRTGDAPDGKDQNVVGTNPCITADTWVLTASGPRRAGDLVGTPITLRVDGQLIHTQGFFKTGIKPVYTLATREGYSVNLTGDHKVLTRDNIWKKAEDLTEGDKIVLNNHNVAPTWDGHGSKDEGYIIGHFIGDGTWAKNSARLCSWGDTDGEKIVRDYIESILGKNWNYGKIYNSIYGTDIISKYLMIGTKEINDLMQTASWSFQVGLLRGLFDSDGHVEGRSTSGGISIRLSQSNRELLEDVQRILLRAGIRSKINLAREAGIKMMPDGQGSLAEYNTKTSWRLIITSDCDRFMEYIGFHNSDKSKKYNELRSTMTRGFYDKPFEAAFESLEYVGEREVFDVQVPSLNAFDANGLYVHNCGEIFLESSELCNLSELFPNHHEDINDFKRSIKHAYMYNKAVTLLPTPWPETNEVINRNRRIGLSVSGTVQFLESKSHPEYKHWLEEAYQEVLNRDSQYSAWLGIRESIRHTTSKPSGSVSILAGATPGVHWPTNSIYIRRMRLRPDSDMAKILAEAGYKVEPDVMDPDNTVVVELPTKGPDVRTEKDVTIWEKASVAALVQKHFADNAVSCTITFKASEKNQIGAVLRTFEGQLKSISFLPILEGETTYEQMPYEAISLEEYEQSVQQTKPVNWKKLYNSKKAEDALGDKFCSSDKCEIKF